MVVLFALPTIPTVLHSSMSKQGPPGLPKLKQAFGSDVAATAAVQPNNGDLCEAYAQEGVR
jgi:hypothetical protein